MPLGTVILIIVGILVFFGFAHRVLDRMRLSDRAALAFIGLAVVGSFIDVTIITGPAELMINLGGSLVPVALAVWLIATADHAGERWRAVLGAVAAGAALYGLTKILPREPQALPIEPTYLFAVIAGVLAYILGRSRRGAFTAAILGVTLADLGAWLELIVTRTSGRAWLGGAGMLDATVISGLVAVLIAELLGESLELAAGGPRATRRRAQERTGEEVDTTPRGSEVDPGDDRRTSALAPPAGPAADRRDQVDRDQTGQRGQAGQPGGVNEQGPAGGDLDRLQLEEPHQFEANRASPTDHVGSGQTAAAAPVDDRLPRGQQPGRGGERRHG